MITILILVASGLTGLLGLALLLPLLGVHEPPPEGWDRVPDERDHFNKEP